MYGKQTIYAFDRGTVLAGRRSWRGQAAAGAAAKGETDPVQPPPRLRRKAVSCRLNQRNKNQTLRTISVFNLIDIYLMILKKIDQKYFRILFEDFGKF